MRWREKDGVGVVSVGSAEVVCSIPSGFFVHMCLVRHGRGRPGDHRRPASNLAGKLVSQLIAGNPCVTWHPHHSDRGRE